MIKIIFVTLIVIFLIPLLLTGYIKLQRKHWETDRNFYGNEIIAEKLKIVKNDYQTVQCQTKNFVKVKRNKKIECDYYEDNDKIFTITQEDYNRYVKGADVFYAYRPICKLTYQSERGRLTADFISEKYSITPRKFSDNELKDVKQKIIKESKDKIFSTYSDEEAVENLKKNQKKSFISKFLYSMKAKDTELIRFEDKNGRKLTTLFTVTNNDYEANICGRSLVKSSKYDQLFEDSCFYLPSPELNHAENQLLLFAALLNIHYCGNFFAMYVAFFALIYILSFFFLLSNLLSKIDKGDYEIDKMLLCMFCIVGFLLFILVIFSFFFC